MPDYWYRAVAVSASTFKAHDVDGEYEGGTVVEGLFDVGRAKYLLILRYEGEDPYERAMAFLGRLRRLTHKVWISGVTLASAIGQRADLIAHHKRHVVGEMARTLEEDGMIRFEEDLAGDGSGDVVVRASLDVVMP